MGRTLDLVAVSAVGIPVVLFLVTIGLGLSWLLAGVLLTTLAFERLVIALLIIAILAGGGSSE